MGLSGKDYDRAYPEYTPNKDRRMAEWRAKKAKEKKESDETHRQNLGKIAEEITRRESEKEERRELSGPVTPTPITRSEPPATDAVPATPKPRKSRRKQFEGPHQPTLFDGVE